MALCHFWGRADFRNAQAVRAHLRACGAYRTRDREEWLYWRWRSLQSIPGGSPAAETRLRARYEADQAQRGIRPAVRRALCSFCGRADFCSAQAVRAHLQACAAYRTRRPGGPERDAPG